MPSKVSLILALAAKDWRLFLADRRAAVLCFAVPIVLASAFGLVFHRAPGKSGAPRLSLLVVDEDGGPFTRRVVDDLLASARVEAEVVTAAVADERVADRRPGVAVVFPKGFDALTGWTPGAAGERPSVRILHDPLSESESQWAEGVVSEVVMRRLARDRLAPVARALGGTADDAAAVPFAVETVAVTGSRVDGFNSYTHSFSGMTLQYLLFWGMESGLLLLRERQRSLWHRLRAAPVPLWAILLGKATSTASIAFLQVVVTFAFGYAVFGVTIGGSWIGFILLAVGVSLLSAATGLLVAAVGGTEARARSVSILVILGVSMLGGLWLPSFVLPGWARDLALSLPTTWAMRGLDGVTWQGRDLLSALPSVAVVLAFAAVFLAVAVARLVTSEARRRRGMA
ncbi:ABC transporter permease [Fimbriiglobus ruber]|uniref:ABC-type multidrug transport system, permease component n=1 Tax=Fimbriiglobus ruber TaxID=1908690 RepID=A0A225E6G0_9BACT|nr:ABC transporter permease [Fimbriiglobus ruber]OWK45696.1 ABC-type multidrug transport system, permease component [Fimbriiglobus ruber]